MEDLRHEVFRVALLDAQNRLLRDVVISEGTLSASLVHPREVFKPAILESAASIILLHNHPSGDPAPSQEDVRLTRQLVECARLMDLRIHDHVVIGRGRYVSLAEKGMI
jgi:DNA repair protein RadC